MNGFEPKQFGKFYLIEKIAVGGMAEIYKAKTFGVDGFEKLLAIKRILPHCAADKDFITMLTDEAKLSVLLSHANIVQVYDFGKVGDDYFISMEYIHGINLRDIMYRCREAQMNVPPEIAVYIISEMCKGLDYAHRKSDANGQPLNIVHRDVSPQNILISYEGEVKIVDFGIAKAQMNISHTMAGILKGKIAYMSPEQALGKAIDHRTDIFSAGILLYEMLTNSKLYTGESQFEVLKKIRTTRIEEGKLPATIPQQIKWVVAKALAYKAEDRFQNAGDLQIELTKYLYSTYLDFSPRKLAAFIKEVFVAELKDEQIRRAREAALESQTASMNVAEGAKQQEIVHRETSVTPIEPQVPEAQIETMVAPAAAGVEKEVTTERRRVKPKKGVKWPLAVAALPILAAAAYGLVRFVPAARFWEKKEAPAIGMLNVTSVPEGAKVLLDGRDTKLTTPATIPDLKLGTQYLVRLEKDDFKPVEKSVKITSAEPVPLQMELKQAGGILNVISDPPGAAILVDGKTTGQTTPATIEDIELNTDHKITMSKPEYEDFEQVVNLTSLKPQKFSAVLKPSGKAPATEPSAPLPVIPPPLPPAAPPPAVATPTAPALPPATPPPAAEAAKEEFGQINVTSNPSGARIILDGRATGKQTPATIDKLKVGKSYTVGLAKDEYERWSKKITIASVKPMSVQGELKTAPKPAEKPSEIEKPVETTPPPAGTAPGTPAQIRISSNPSGADVFVNAEFKGKTPLTASVAPGSVSVIVSKEGLTRFSKKITVKPGEKVNLTDINLSDVMGEVSLSSTPPRASVVFDGQAIPAKTPVTIRGVRRDKSHSVSVSLPGYKTWSTSFQMSEGNKSFNVVLEEE